MKKLLLVILTLALATMCVPFAVAEEAPPLRIGLMPSAVGAPVQLF